MVMEYARDVLGYADANSSEFTPDGEHNVIALMPDQQGNIPKGGTMRLGKYPCITAEGTKLIIVDENSEHDEYAEVFTVYQGYFIGLLLEPAGDVQVSQEELDMAVQFLSDMQFVHTEA